MAGGFLGRLALLLMSGGALDKMPEEGEMTVPADRTI